MAKTQQKLNKDGKNTINMSKTQLRYQINNLDGKSKTTMQ